MKDYARILDYCSTHNLTGMRDVPLREHCSFKIGGTADLMLQPDSEEAFADILAIVREEALPLLVLGKG